MRKQDLVLDYLKAGNSITAMQATDLFGTTKLTTIISVLRKKHNIIGIRHEGLDCLGNPTHWNEYTYLGEIDVK
ncbi:MAG: hypothetical protein KBT03_13590 [Bacteroidales bacterium]|nr:hypothetical protein [Candidatus Scybalousia scybalohippi]